MVPAVLKRFAVHAGHLAKVGGRPQRARLSRWMSHARRILAAAESLAGITDAELLARGRELQWRSRCGEPPAGLLDAAFALGIEATFRTMGFRHFPVQVCGGLALFEGGVAQLHTGEGKTVTAVLPALLRALPGRGCHVITSNDYLAERDAELVRPIFARLGLSVGCIYPDLEPEPRREAYRMDVTYGTAQQFGFDYLRDQLERDALGKTAEDDCAACVQRGHYFALVDESDSVLVDEARTPLIIGLPQAPEASLVCLYHWCRAAAEVLVPEVDFVYEHEKRSAHLSDDGCLRVTLLGKPDLLDSLDADRIYEQIERALVAHHGFARDRDYIVIEGQVAIVDESTGRAMPGRKWQDGLHQAIEAKEQLDVTETTGSAAQITLQSYFRNYRYLAGMTGTGVQVRREVRRFYGLKTTAVPTNRTCLRKTWPTRIFADRRRKFLAAAAEIRDVTAAGRAVIVGTPSVEVSDAFSDILTECEIVHDVLNARSHAREAEIVKQAGQPGRVTIATNMAGRGTDIKLHPDVRARGGLHVILTEMHSSARIDRQLIGRCARQGDPGTVRFYLSLEDELLDAWSEKARRRLRRLALPNRNGELSRMWLVLFRRTQAKLERTFAKQRKQMLKSEKQRREMFARMGFNPCLDLPE
jgi:preprotein translocase subunit SecA